MIGNVSLNCTPLKQELKFNNNKLNTNPAFGTSKDIEEPQDNLDLDTQAEEKITEDIEAKKSTKQLDKKSFIKKFADHFKGMSYTNAAKQFGQGFIDPLKQLWEKAKTKDGFTTIAIGGAGTLIIMNTAKSIRRYAVAAGALFGAYNIGKGIIKFAKADKADEKENSFHDAGKGTFYLASALVGAKGAANSQANITKATADTNPVKALWLNIKSTGKDFKSLLNPDNWQPAKLRSILGMAEYKPPIPAAAAGTIAETDMTSSHTSTPNAAPASPDVTNTVPTPDSPGQIVKEITGNDTLARATDTAAAAFKEGSTNMILADGEQPPDEESDQ